MRRPWTFDLHVGADDLGTLEQGMHEALEALRLHLARPTSELLELDGLVLTERGIVLDASVALVYDDDAPTVQQQTLEAHAAAGGALSPARARQLAETRHAERQAELEPEREELLERAGLGTIPHR